MTARRTASPQPPKPTDADRAMMRRALRLARRAASLGEAPIGAVIYDTDTGELLAEAHNTRETLRDPLGHAELLAIRDAAKALGDWRLNHCTLVVTLEPCPMCAGAIVNARVGRLVYGAPDPKAGAVHTLYTICADKRLNHRIDAVPGVMAKSSATLLRKFFQARREAKKASKPPKTSERG
ncbi:MAG: nucleoside deaminase [Phycisphaerales bacterium]